MSAPRLGLIANAAKAGAAELTNALVCEFGRRGVPVRLEASTARLLSDRLTFPTDPGGSNAPLAARDLAAESDLLLVLGGDGTMLQVLHDLDGSMPPLFGINLGTLGFLTCVAAADWSKAVESVVSGDYQLSERTLIEVEVRTLAGTKFRQLALNDAVISRGEISRLIRLDVQIDGASLTEYNADGLIIATPTGSTAYSLSAGGPVLSPESGVFVVTPICPHVLTNRSVIVSDSAEIAITPANGASAVFLTVDGQNSIRIEEDDRIDVRKATKRLKLAMLPGTTFFEVLRQKLKWSGAAV